MKKWSIRVLVMMAFLVPGGAAHAAAPSQPVTVTNTPLPVELTDTVPVEFTPVEPVHVFVTGSIPPGPSGAAFVLYTVPVGMRLVVEHASAEASIATGETAFFWLADAGGQRWHSLIASSQGEFNGADIYAASQAVRFVVGSGEVVQLTVGRSTPAAASTLTVTAALSGYLVVE